MSGSFPSRATFIDTRDAHTRHLNRVVIALLMLIIAFAGGRAWLSANPRHNALPPFDLRQSEGWTTGETLAALRRDPASCRTVHAAFEWR